MPRSSQGFVEIGLRQLDEPIVCHGCGAEVAKARVTERRNLKKAVRLYECPHCGNNLFGGRGIPDPPSP
jgi:DNA-directed RNA polymerase subunit RPC12/RpoP